MSKVENNGSETANTRIAPNRVRLEATNVCQLKCPTCVTATGELYGAMAKGFLRFKNFKTFVDRNPAIDEIELSNRLPRSRLRELETSAPRRCCF